MSLVTYPEKSDIIKSWSHVYVIIPRHQHDSGIVIPEKVIGTFQVVNKDKFGTYLEWHPSLENLLEAEGSYDSQQHATIFSNRNGSYRIPHVSIDIDDIRCFKIHGGEGAPARLTFITNEGTSHPTLELPETTYNMLINFLQERILIERSAKDPHLCLVRDRTRTPRRANLPYEMPQAPSHFLQKFARAPVSTAFMGLSKVQSFLMNTLDNIAPVYDDMDKASAASTPSSFQMPPLGILQSNDDQDFEVISIKAPLELPPRPYVMRRPPLSLTEWSSFFDEEGRISDANTSKAKEIIFKGGVDSSIRKDVWKYLLGYYAWNVTTEERAFKRHHLVEDYRRMKTQWSSITPDQERRFAIWRERKDLIEKDVYRTDRTHPYFEGKSVYLKSMNEILMTYCMYNFDLGYVQGMSDLLAPVMVIMDGDEVDSFWCLSGVMDRISHGFDMGRLTREMIDLSVLMKYLDPALKNYIDANDPRLYFCFRWLLVQFKREFSFDDIMRLWEIFWTGLPCKNFHLIFAYAILDLEKNTLTENRFSATEILRHVNDLSMNINLEDTLKRAESIYLQLIHAEELPTSIRKVIGLPPLTSDTSVEQDSFTDVAGNHSDRHSDAVIL